MPAHWWVDPGPRVSGCRALVVLELVCWPTGGQGWVPGCPWAGAYTLVSEAGPTASVGQLVGGAESQGVWLQGPGGSGANACALVYRVGSWTLSWTGPGPTVALGSGGLRHQA